MKKDEALSLGLYRVARGNYVNSVYWELRKKE